MQKTNERNDETGSGRWTGPLLSTSLVGGEKAISRDEKSFRDGEARNCLSVSLSLAVNSSWNTQHEHLEAPRVTHQSIACPLTGDDGANAEGLAAS